MRRRDFIRSVLGVPAAIAAASLGIAAAPKLYGRSPAVDAQGPITLLDAIKRTDPDGNVARIVDHLNERNPILDDVPMMTATEIEARNEAEARGRQ